jgi:hypothetical protein
MATKINNSTLQSSKPYLCELPFEPHEMDPCEVGAKVGWDVQVYAVHAAELGHPAHHQRHSL